MNRIEENKITDFVSKNFDEEIAELLSSNRIKIKEYLYNINPVLSNIYLSIIYLFEKDLPSYETFVAHGVREIINIMTRDYKPNKEILKKKKKIKITAKNKKK